MTTRFRPIHSGFETLRIAGLAPRSTQGYHRFGSATNEQMTSRAMAHPGWHYPPGCRFRRLPRTLNSERRAAMTVLLHPIRTLRENLFQIGAAVNASREFSRAGAARIGAETINPATAAIPL